MPGGAWIPPGPHPNHSIVHSRETVKPSEAGAHLVAYTYMNRRYGPYPPPNPVGCGYHAPRSPSSPKVGGMDPKMPPPTPTVDGATPSDAFNDMGEFRTVTHMK